MKKIIYILGCLLLLVAIVPKLLWKVEVIDKRKHLAKNHEIIQDNLNLWTLNSRPFFTVIATVKCEDSQDEFNIHGYLYNLDDASDNSKVYSFTANNIGCSQSQMEVRLVPESPLPKFQRLTKLKIVTTEDLYDYQLIWYNAEP